MKIDWLQIVHLITPIVLQVVPGAAPLTPYVMAGIQEAEALHGATGPAKKEHALQIVANGIAATNTAAKRTLVDPQAATRTADAVIDLTVGIANTIRDRSVPAMQVEEHKKIG